jgi:hypothetical protein
MPVIIRRNSKILPVGHRRGQFNAAVGELAPIVAEIRNNGVQDVRGIAKCLNERGIAAPSGRPFVYTSTLRVLKRLEQLQLGPGPRSLSAAATTRSPNRRPRKRGPAVKQALLRIAREHGES